MLSLHLGEGDRALALFDNLPEGDPGRRSIGIFAQQEFLKRQRYEDAASVKPFGAMLNELDRGAQRHVTNPAIGADLYLASVVESTATNIEILTGAKRLTDARLLTERLLAFDDTEATRAAIKRHIERIPPK